MAYHGKLRDEGAAERNPEGGWAGLHCCYSDAATERAVSSGGNACGWTRRRRIVRIEGKGSKSSSVFTGETEMFRQYVDIDGFAEATHARAESDSFLFGETVVTIVYRDYQVQLRPGS